MILTCRKKQTKVAVGKGVWIFASSMAIIWLVAGCQYFERTTQTVPEYEDVERVKDEVNLHDYKPFSSGNLLIRIKDKPTLSISSDYPRLDGATAAYPVYGAIVQEIYKDLSEETVSAYVKCTMTDNAYARLINDDIDIFFGAQPSKQQVEAAKAMGLEFELLPIGKEAFVFFVNADNPVDELSLEQIKGIYTKKITNWRKLGGLNEKIMPFQRPEGSGSQTIMLAAVMGDTLLPPPLHEEYSDGMGSMIGDVAAYRNYSSAIGYSFRFFTKEMKTNDSIKLLAIDGIEPSGENIRNGAYPFTVDVYAITARPKSENTQKLLDWIISEQGQDFIEMCGYVRQ